MVLNAELYSYDSATGTITIPANRITGNITITAVGEKIQYYVVGTDKLCGVDWIIDAPNKLTEQGNGMYTITYERVAAGAYEIKVQDTAGNWYSGSVSENNYVIYTDRLSDVVITFDANNNVITYSTSASVVSVTHTGENVTMSGAASVTAGESYSATLTAANGYVLPASVLITVDGVRIESGYTYDRNTGAITIDGSAVNGNIEIAASGVGVYSATYSGTNATVTGSDTVYSDTDLVVSVAPNSGYIMPAVVVVKVGDTTLTEGQYTFDRVAGTVTIPAEYLTGNVQVSATGDVVAYYIVGDESLTGQTDWAMSEANRMTPNGDGTYSITYPNIWGDTDGHYEIKVRGNDGTWYSGSNDANNDSNYWLVFDYLGNLTITFTPNNTQGIITYEIPPLEFDVTFTGSDVTFSGNSKATTKEAYSATLTPKAGFMLPENISVTIGGVELTSGYTYDRNTGKVTIDKNQLTGKVEIKADAIEKVYIVAGSDGLCGSSWDPSDTKNQMTLNDDGTYSIIYDYVEAGNHLFKVTMNGDWLWPSENYALNLTGLSRVTIHYNPTTGEGWVDVQSVSPKEKYDRMNVIPLPSDSVFYADVALVDYLNNNRVMGNAAEGYYTDNQGEWLGQEDAVYSYLNNLISEQVMNAGYSYPLFFGPLHFVKSRYSKVVGSDAWLSLGNWSTAANVAFGTSSGGTNVSGVVQGLVGNRLDANGNLIDPVNGTPLLYFNKTAAQNWTNNGHRVMAYYDNLKFPFKKTYDAATRVTTYSYDSATDYAVYYDYENNQLYASNTFVEDQKGNKGFYPLNEPDDRDNEVNNGFGAKFSIDFTVGDKGVLANGEPVTFEFTGDDDVWVFIDGVLVLDMGGAHAKANGKIDFSTLTATVANAASVTDSYMVKFDTTYEASSFRGKNYNNYLYNNDIEERAVLATSTKTKSFADLGLDFDYDQVHTMTVFYMERGMFESNFSMEFTMVPVPSGLTVSKNLNDKDINAGLLNAVSNTKDFNFYMYATSPSNTSVVFTNYTITDKYTGKATLMNANGTTSGRTYEAYINGVTNHAYAHSFFTSAGEDAFIPGTSFSIAETTNGIFKYDATSWAVYDAQNGYSLVTGSSGKTAAFTMGSAGSTKAYSYAVSFTNTMQLGNLSITKIFDDAMLASNAFKFRVYLDLDGEGTNFVDALYPGLVYTIDGKSYTSTDGTVSVTGGKTAVITGIPAGATYRIEEVISDDDAWYQSEAVNTTGTIENNGTAAASFTNVTKTSSADKVIFVEAGTATDYTIVLNGKTVTVSEIVPVTGLNVDIDGTKLTVTGADANQAYTAAYTGRYPDGSIVSGTLTVYTFAATHKTYVFDFGLASDLAATTVKGDGLFQGGNFFNDHIEGTTAMLNTLVGNGNVQTTISSESAWIYADGKSAPVRFQPVAFMSRVENYTYTVQIIAPGASFDPNDPNDPETGCTITGTIKVMPANSVYYEDNFNVSGDDSTEKIIFGGGAKGQSEAPNMMQSNEQFTNYGYDGCYNSGYQYNGYLYSGGNAVTLENMQYAYFTFTGDGFDLISRTADDTAGIALYVFAGKHDASHIDYLTNLKSKDTPAEMVFVNNYYNNGNLYQVPVIKVDMNTAVKERDEDDNPISYWCYGEYTVYIQCLSTYYASKVQIDGVRIYNPMSDDTSKYPMSNTSQYPLLSERNTHVDELRVLYKNDYVSLAGNSPTYGIFVGTGKQSVIESIIENMDADKYTTADDLESIFKSGPNNEMYLPESFGIRLRYTVSSKETFTMQIGMKAIGSAKTVAIYARVKNTGSYVKVGSINIASTTDMYYDLSAMLKDYSAAGSSYDLVLISESPDTTNQFVSLTTVKYSGLTLTS